MQGIPLIMSGRDIVIHSETGSGKTLTYVLPLLKLLQQIPVSTPQTGPVALIIAPTRELADQIHTTISHFMLSPLIPEFMIQSYREEDVNLVEMMILPHPQSQFTSDGRFRHRVLGTWGGESLPLQHMELSKGIDILVSTPGRLIDLLSKGWVSLQQ